MKFLFLFLDGVGLGADDAENNPLAASRLPNLENLLGGQRLIQEHQSFPIHTERATLLTMDACLGIEGRPQSASGQATLLTGKNVPALIGQHYGPKPNPEIRTIIENGNLFYRLKQFGFQVGLLNAFPEGYFQAIDSGRRIPGAIVMAARAAGVPIKTWEDLYNGQALSADFTGQGWREHLKMADSPLITSQQAGIRLAELASTYDFSFFEYWISDYVGHKRDRRAAGELLQSLDQVIGGLLSAWDDHQGLILITSDHGNLENLEVRNHTLNPVPALLIGTTELRQSFAEGLENLADVYPAILRIFKDTNA